MTRSDEGTIVAMRDGALVDADDRMRVENSPAGMEELREAGRRADRIADTLAHYPTPIDLDRAKAEVRARLDAQRRAERPRPRIHLTLGKAASLVLLGAAAASALPNSPVRSWVEGRLTPAASVEVAAPIVAAGEEIEVPVGTDGLVVALRGVPEGEEIEVLWTVERTARISAADGSSFTFAAGRAEAIVTGGPVLLVLPQSAGPIRVDVNGRRVLSRQASDVELPEGSVEESAERIILAVPQH
ncbi:MAG: hypothetical protein AAF389_04270 [Gemmatimonadota bacterium]